MRARIRKNDILKNKSYEEREYIIDSKIKNYRLNKIAKLYYLNEDSMLDISFEFDLCEQQIYRYLKEIKKIIN